MTIEGGVANTLIFLQFDLSLEDTKDLSTPALEPQTSISASKTTKVRQDKMATKSAQEQGVSLTSEETEKLIPQQSASAESGQLTEAKEEKSLATKKPKKSGVSLHTYWSSGYK